MSPIYELLLPGRMSLTRTVPAAKPFDRHSSAPLTPLLARKKSVPLRLVKEEG